MTSPRPSTEPVRVLLLQTDLVASLHLRLAIEMSPIRSAVTLMGKSPRNVRAMCESIRAGAAPPDVVIVECDPREVGSRQALTLVGAAPELQGARLVVIGDGKEAEEEALALSLGAGTFIARPERTSDLARMGSEITRVFGATLQVAS